MSKKQQVLPTEQQPPAPVGDKRTAFAADYEALCKKHGLQLIAQPSFRPRDDGTFSVVIQFQVAPFQPK